MVEMGIEFSHEASQLTLYVPLVLFGVVFVYFALRFAERRRVQRLTALVDHGLALRLVDGFWTKAYRPAFWAAVIGTAMLALAILGPRWGSVPVEVKRGSRDILILLDTSESMLADDIRPSRLQRAKQKIEALLDTCRGDRFGLIAFSGNAAVQCPLTLDHAYFKTVLNVVDTDTLSDEGTNIQAAMEEARRVFEEDIQRTGAADRWARAVVMVSDAEETTGAAINVMKDLSQYAQLVLLGVGTPEGAQVNFPAWMRQYVGNPSGQPVVKTRLNEDLFVRIAQETNGLYVRVTPNNADIERIIQELEALRGRMVSGNLRQVKVNRYRVPLFVAVACFFFEGLWVGLLGLLRARRQRQVEAQTLKARKAAVQNRKEAFPAETIIVLFLIMAMLPGYAFAAESLRSRLERAKAAYESGQAEEAIQQLRDLQVENPDDPDVQYALGCALYVQAKQASDASARTQTLNEALQCFEKAATQSPNPAQRKKAAFNKALCLAREAEAIDRNAQYEQAVAAYRESVEAFAQVVSQHPDFAEAEHNLAALRFSLKQLLQNPPKPPETPPQSPPPPSSQQSELHSRFLNPETEVPQAEVTLPAEDVLELKMPTGGGS